MAVLLLSFFLVGPKSATVRVPTAICQSRELGRAAGIPDKLNQKGLWHSLLVLKDVYNVGGDILVHHQQYHLLGIGSVRND